MHLFIINSNQWNIYLRRVALFLSIFYVIDISTASILGFLYKQVYTGPGRYNYIKENRFDCLIMGSSTSTCYYSDYISKELGISVLNVGLDGSALSYSRCILDLVVTKKVKPNIVILNIDLFEIQKNAWLGNYYSMIEKLSPLYGESKVIDKALNKGRPFEFLKYKIATYKYNDIVLSLIMKNLRNNTKIYQREKSPEKVLSLPLDKETIDSKFKNELNVDERKTSLYEEFIIECKKQGIKLFFVESPLYYPEGEMILRDKKIESIFDKIADKNDIPFIKITQNTYPVFKTNLLFKDVLHLNDKGSIIFSKILCDEIKKHGI